MGTRVHGVDWGLLDIDAQDYIFQPRLQSNVFEIVAEAVVGHDMTMGLTNGVGHNRQAFSACIRCQ